MADVDYKRLGCVADECSKQAGRKLGLCLAHYARFKTYGYTGDHKATCKHCGVEFFAKDKRLSQCVDCAQKDIRPSRKELNQLRLEQSKWSAYCMTCNSWFWREPGGANRKKRSFNKFCSQQCAFEMSKKVTAERDALFRIGVHYENKKAKEKNNAVSQLVLAIKKIAKRKNKQEMASRSCKTCGKQVGYNFGSPKTFCSKACAKANVKTRPEYKELIKAHRKRRKAIERGAKHGESFNYRQIFERDKWRCQMCRIKTPEKLRGTYEPNAPELDHILPLSKGGLHSIDNAQLLCRKCNQWKSDKVLPHQQGLFTSLL
jgi:5-methylcytosine-specific restriction endonuclease McrA